MERKILLEINIYYRQWGTLAHIGLKVPQNRSEHLNLPKMTSYSQSRASKTLERKISLQSNNSYREKGTEARFGIKVPQNESNYSNSLKAKTNLKSTSIMLCYAIQSLKI